MGQKESGGENPQEQVQNPGRQQQEEDQAQTAAALPARWTALILHHLLEEDAVQGRVVIDEDAAFPSSKKSSLMHALRCSSIF